MHKLQSVILEHVSVFIDVMDHTAELDWYTVSLDTVVVMLSTAL
jgi:hypothetical protein